MRKLKVLVTAGPTYEPIDPVRFIGNRSTGKMGYAIVDELVRKGYEVVLISGPTSLPDPQNAEVFRVQTAQEMYEKAILHFPNVDLAILSAAVADYTPKVVADKKIKKKEDTFSIELIKTKDIAAELGKLKTSRQKLVGFALETDNEFENARKKINSKNLDAIVLNSLNNEGTCFGFDQNKIYIIDQNTQHDFPLKNKEDVAKDIVAYIESNFKF